VRIHPSEHYRGESSAGEGTSKVKMLAEAAHYGETD